MQFEGRTLHRIRYLRQTSRFIKKDDIGGWIESESNFSHDEECYILNEAKVFGNARVTQNGTVENNAIVKDNALLRGHSRVLGNAIVGADTIMDDTSWVKDNSKVFFYADLSKSHSSKANILGDSLIGGSSIIEATGTINHSYVFSMKIYGKVDRINKR